MTEVTILEQISPLHCGTSSPPPLIFELLDGDAFILQVQGVFTRICSGAVLVADGAYTLGFLLSIARRQ
jgi:hypothetical protein